MIFKSKKSLERSIISRRKTCVNITLECTSCKERNYLTNKNKRNNPDRLEKQKYCPRERKVTLHRETK